MIKREMFIEIYIFIDTNEEIKLKIKILSSVYCNMYFTLIFYIFVATVAYSS